jgi:hypothetical protein
MLKTSRLTAAYLIGVLVLSSIDVIYEWFSPLVSETGQSTDWYEVAGLRAGAVAVGSYYGGFTRGLVTDIHLPQFFPLPFFAGAGPEGGVVGIAVWFLGVAAWIIHLLVRLRARRFPGTPLNTPEK